jgi:calcium-dependent protein kinase
MKGDEIRTKSQVVFAKDQFVLSKKNKFTDDYKLKETLGEGAFGVVGKCENLTSAAIRAVKMLSKKNITKEDLKSIANEIQLCKELDHPNIMKMYEEYEDSKFLYIVTELIQGGELFDELIRRKKFTEKDCAIIVKQLLEALCYCHANNIAHKDLKPENILLQKKKDINSIKLIDFGTAQRFKKGAKMSSIIGTPYYVAPEVLEGSYNEKCDIWGVGVIMFILLSGTPPFNGKNDDEIMKNVQKGKYEFKVDKWKGISDEAKSLIDQMLVLDPDERISAKDSIEHAWFKKVLSDDYEPIKLKGAISGLKKFEAEQKMQQAALGFIVTQLATKEDTEDLDKAFKRIDKNHDGKLSLEELLEGAQEVFPEMTEDEVKELFRHADTDKSGDIDYTEWIQATVNKKALLTDKNLKSAFKAFDEDGSGTITADEIKKFLGQGKKIDKNVWKEILAEVDENDDGEIDFEEFKGMMSKFLE